MMPCARYPLLTALMAVAMLSACGGGGGKETSGVSPDVVYQGAQYAQGQLTAYGDVSYSQRPNPEGINYTDIGTKASEKRDAVLTLKMDIWVPPNASATRLQPLVITIHGGGFSAGSKTDDAVVFPISYARAGYVAAAINYRLTENPDLTPERRLAAQRMALEDLQNAVRYLRANAAAYSIDPTRIATVGASAGGALSLMNAADANDVANVAPGSDYPGVSAQVAAAVSTGATLIDPLVPGSYQLLAFNAGDSPVQLFHASPDPFTGATWTGNVLPTQKLFTDAGVRCDVVQQRPNNQHTVLLGVQSNSNWDTLWPFLRQELRLGALQQ